MDKLINYTTINHIARKKMDLSMHEYAVSDIIYNLSNNPKNEYQGWCYASKDQLGKMIDLSKQSIHMIINKLLKKKIIEKHPITKHLRVSVNWYNEIIIKDSKESLLPVKKVYSDSKESLLDHIYNKDINKDINSNTTKEVVLLEKTSTIGSCYGNPDINDLQSYFLKVFQIPKEDCTQKQSRQYWYLLIRESKSGVSGVKWLIDTAYQDEYYKNNITSSKDLYYKRVKIITRKRGKKPRIAVMPIGGELDGQEKLEINNRDRSFLPN